MKKLLLAASLLTAGTALNAAPAIDFVGLGWPTFNTTLSDNTTFSGIAIGGYTYSGGTTYSQGSGYLWLRNNPDDHGLGYCSSGETCGASNTTGGGDYNELSNQNKPEIIRLTLSTGKVWTDIQVSSLDDGGTNGDETGTLYWSNVANPNLNNGTTSFINFSHDGMGWGSAHEGSIFNFLVGQGLDVNAKYLFFRAGEWDNLNHSTNGTNNDYLVWGVGVANPIPEPETYAMLLAGLALLGFEARRKRKHQQAAA